MQSRLDTISKQHKTSATVHTLQLTIMKSLVWFIARADSMTIHEATKVMNGEKLDKAEILVAEMIGVKISDASHKVANNRET